MSKVLHFDLITDSAAMAIYDPALLQHRQDDSDDWWTLWEESLAEMNAGLFFLCKLGADGLYSVTFGSIPDDSRKINGTIRVASGQIVCCSGDDILSGGLEQQLLRGGRRIAVKPGHYEVTVARSVMELFVKLTPTSDGELVQHTIIPRLSAD